MGFLIRCGYLVPMDSDKVLRDHAVIVEDTRIIDVLSYKEARGKYPRYEVIDLSDSIVLPGLVNLHTHAAMSLLRGYADDLPLHIWLQEKIWPLEAKLSAQDIYYGALLAAAESAIMGTTILNTMYHFIDSEFNEASAISKIGIRAVVGHVCFSWRKDEDKRYLDILIRRWHGAKEGLIRASIDPHAPYTVDPEYMKELRALTDDYNERYSKERGLITFHIHVAETQDEPERIGKAFNIRIKGGVISYLDSIGVLRNDTIAAHCVWLTHEDIDVLAKRGVNVAHNPISNLKLASGISPIHRLIKKGINVGLGTDSACSNNTLDMFETMKVASLLPKGIQRDPTLIPAKLALKMATINGIKALGWESELGSITPDKRADMIAVSYKKPHLFPIYDPISHLVYSARSLDVKFVMVNGKIIVEEGKLKTVDLSDILKKVEKIQEGLLSKLGG